MNIITPKLTHEKRQKSALFDLRFYLYKSLIMDKKEDKQLSWSEGADTYFIPDQGIELKAADGKLVASITPNMNAGEYWDGYNVRLSQLPHKEHPLNEHFKELIDAKAKANEHGQAYLEAMNNEKSGFDKSVENLAKKAQKGDLQPSQDKDRERENER